MKKYSLIILIAVLFVFADSCTVQTQNFDVEKWKAGSKSVRGSMISDIKSSGILRKKTKLQVEDLLGKADASQKDWLGYKVTTISRCYFWNCLMEINFDPQTKKTIGDIAVSD